VDEPSLWMYKLGDDMNEVEPRGPCLIMPKELWEAIFCNPDLGFEFGSSC